MKKLLILALVLGMTSSSGSTLTLEPECLQHQEGGTGKIQVVFEVNGDLRVIYENVDIDADEFYNECFPPGHPDYAQWLAVGMPECWCYPRQCHGDADGLKEGCPKCGYYHVDGVDLGCLLTAWKILEPADPPTPSGPGIGSVPNGICADFDHQQEGDPRVSYGYYYVGASDLYILLTAWKVLEPADPPTPSGPGIGSVPNGICADFDHMLEGDPKGGYFRVGAGDLCILLTNWKVLDPAVPPDCLDVP